MKDPKIEKLEKEVKDLKQEVQRLRNELNSRPSGCSCQHIHHYHYEPSRPLFDPLPKQPKIWYYGPGKNTPQVWC